MTSRQVGLVRRAVEEGRGARRLDEESWTDQVVGHERPMRSYRELDMRFWKAFAWIAFLFSLVARRGKGVLIRKASQAESEAPDQQRGRGWRRVSRNKPGRYPTRRD